jgi:pimeloyl-ACP methyl ester carboxylesterase
VRRLRSLAVAVTVVLAALTVALADDVVHSPVAVAASENGLNARQYAEQWASLSGWRSVGVTVRANRLYGTASKVTGASRAMAVPTGADSRVRASIQMVPNGSGGLTSVGISTTAPGSSPAGAYLVSIGFNSAGQPVAYRGARAGGTGLTVLDATRQPAGWYWITVTTDSTGLMLVMTNSDGSREWRSAVRRTQLGGQIGNVTVWNSDARGTRGSTVGALGYRLSAAPITAGTGIEGRAPSSSWGWGPGTAQHIALPASYNPTVGVPLVIYAHGSSGNELSVLESPAVRVYTAMLNAGYAVASSSQHGNNWGNAASAGDIIALYKYVNARYPVSQVFLLGHSMGGLSTLQVAAARSVPIAAWAGIYPVTNLGWFWTGPYRSAIRAAHGIALNGSDYATRTAGRDPALFAPALFDGLPMRFYASADDEVVPEALNSRMLAGKVAGHAIESEVVPHVGAHGDPTAFKPRDLVDFYNRYRTTP